MSGFISVALAALPLLIGGFTAVWMISLVRRDTGIVDIVWGPSLAGSAWFYYAAGGGTNIVVPLIISAWGARLALHIFARSRGEGEDYRYREMRDEHGRSWPVRSLFTVFWLQAALAWMISHSLLAAQLGRSPWWVDGAAAALMLGGLIWEAVADYQLARFRSNPKHSGQVMKQGLWRFSRHPNYFGDSVVWWAAWLFAVGSGGWWTVYSPVIMTLLLLRVSGVPLLEKRLESSKPGYREYASRTNAFFPWPPDSGGTD